MLRWTLPVLLLMTALLPFSAYRGDRPDNRDAWAARHRVIAHALGGIEGRTYTNSREALIENYRRGHRIFEVDLQLTRDRRLVARHDWSAGLASALEQPFAAGPVPVETFKTTAIHRRWTPLSFADLVVLLQAHPDIYLVTDTKDHAAAEVTATFTELVQEARAVDATMLDRIVPQIYTRAMLPTVRAIHPFKSYIYTLYQSHDSDRQVVDFIRQERIRVVTMPRHRAKRPFLAQLAYQGAFTYVHTINLREEAQRYRELGAHGVYSDFLPPDSVGASLMTARSLRGGTGSEAPRQPQ